MSAKSNVRCQLSHILKTSPIAHVTGILEHTYHVALLISLSQRVERLAALRLPINASTRSVSDIKV